MAHQFGNGSPSCKVQDKCACHDPSVATSGETRFVASMLSFAKKREQALAKFLALKAAFEKKEKETRKDLEKAGRIWNEVSKKFKWWQRLP